MGIWCVVCRSVSMPDIAHSVAGGGEGYTHGVLCVEQSVCQILLMGWQGGGKGYTHGVLCVGQPVCQILLMG